MALSGLNTMSTCLSAFGAKRTCRKRTRKAGADETEREADRAFKKIISPKNSEPSDRA